jgi:branched-subunit amino acid aminotransferase/4-amino-4-deoxychorismate lyase
VEFGQFYQYKDYILAPVSEPADQEIGLAVADSILFEDGKVIALEKHLARFAKSVELLAPELSGDLDGFIEQFLALVPKSGRWWPRIELHSRETNTLLLRIRPAPEALGDATLWTLPEPDPRLNPNIKGPDLSLGQQLRRKAKMFGGDEAVLLNSEGYISEGALSSIVWWRGDVLCAPSDAIAWLPSVTRELVLQIAAQCDTEVRFEQSKPADLDGCEVWLLSALNGIRAVTNWVGEEITLTKPTHKEAFAKRLRMFARVVS